MTAGTLTVVGTGIQAVAQTSPEALACIESADKVYFVSADALTEYWIRQVNPSAESLNGLYEIGKQRSITYEEMIDRVLAPVASGLNVCFVSYGHPGVFVYSTHEAIRRARKAGYVARMLPAISAEACLFADLGVDPSTSGCQSYEATDFLIYHRRFDTHSSLILWQIGAIGEWSYKRNVNAWNVSGVRILTDILLQHYPEDHMVTVYEAARYPCCDAIILNVMLAELPKTTISAISTLYVPPHGGAEPDLAMFERLSAADAR